MLKEATGHRRDDTIVIRVLGGGKFFRIQKLVRGNPGSVPRCHIFVLLLAALLQ